MTEDRHNNRLRNALSDEDYGLIARNLEEVDLTRGYYLAKAGQASSHVYFPSHGIASVIAVSAMGRRAEAGMVGLEGFAPVASVVPASYGPFDVVVQVPGHGSRLDMEAFQRSFEANPGIRDVILRFLVAFNFQVAYTALSNAVHTVDVRLARWILMSQDRMHSHEIALTHDFISVMLAVRRPSVTIALHDLEGNSLIRSERAMIVVRDRAGLEDYAGDAYGVPERHYRRLMDMQRLEPEKQISAATASA